MLNHEENMVSTMINNNILYIRTVSLSLNKYIMGFYDRIVIVYTDREKS